MTYGSINSYTSFASRNIFSCKCVLHFCNDSDSTFTIYHEAVWYIFYERFRYSIDRRSSVDMCPSSSASLVSWLNNWTKLSQVAAFMVSNSNSNPPTSLILMDRPPLHSQDLPLMLWQHSVFLFYYVVRFVFSFRMACEGDISSQL